MADVSELALTVVTTARRQAICHCNSAFSRSGGDQSDVPRAEDVFAASWHSNYTALVGHCINDLQTAAAFALGVQRVRRRIIDWLVWPCVIDVHAQIMGPSVQSQTDRWLTVGDRVGDKFAYDELAHLDQLRQAPSAENGSHCPASVARRTRMEGQIDLVGRGSLIVRDVEMLHDANVSIEGVH